MHQVARTVAIVAALGLTRPQSGDSQTLSLAAAAGPVFLPGSGASSDWQGLLWLGYRMGNNLGVRFEAMLTGVPGADLLALTSNLVWTFRRRQLTTVEPYLVAGLGTYVKFSEDRFGLNGGVGLRRRVGAVRLFVEARYHRVTRNLTRQATPTPSCRYRLGSRWGASAYPSCSELLAHRPGACWLARR
jgi:hypothetical protein